MVIRILQLKFNVITISKHGIRKNNYSILLKLINTQWTDRNYISIINER